MTVPRSGMRVDYKRLSMSISCTFSRCVPMIARPWCLPLSPILAERPGIVFLAFIVGDRLKWIGLRACRDQRSLVPTPNCLLLLIAPMFPGR